MLSLPLLILLNKSDIPQGINFWELNEKAGLSFIQGREIHIQTSSGTLNNGIETGINRLLLFVNLLREKRLKEEEKNKDE